MFKKNFTIPIGLLQGLLVLFTLSFSFQLKAQKVGVVLSGGGGGGIAHIGVLKALEENEIPIDYITGTSIGALIGGFYAAGYSPEEIEQFVKSDRFQGFTKGEVEGKYRYYFRRSEENASWFSYKFSFDSLLVTNIPTNLINSVPIDQYMMEMFSPVSARANYNFDSLFVPFRCVASDIEDKKSVVFEKGNLSVAIRASMTYPFYLRPILVDGKLLFDGGLYNNFPSNIMTEEFNPDFLIGSIVTGNSPNPNDDNIYLQLRNMLMTKTDFNPDCENGVVLKPWSAVGIFAFDQSQRLIDSGYACTISNMQLIKERITSRITREKLREKRKQFKQEFKPIVFESVEIEGLKPKQAMYIQRSLVSKNKDIPLNVMRKRYFRLAEDDKIKSIFPITTFDSITGKYKLKVIIKKEKDLAMELGGNFSNRPISEGFIGLQYKYLGRQALTLYGNAYFGKLNTSGHGRIKVDFPGKTPFFIESTATYSRWDYFKSSTLFYDLLKPAFLIQEDRFADMNLGLPFGNRAKIRAGGGIANLASIYYQTDNYTSKDTSDRTDFNFGFGKIEYELNTLNRKLYASEGLFMNFRTQYFNGFEFYKPGTTSKDSITSNVPHSWFLASGKIDYYLKTSRHFKIGILGEGVLSSQNFFKNYTSSILSAPAFTPTPESRTLFLEKFRAQKYLAGGIKFIVSPFKKFDVRIEGYIFQPVQSIVKDEFNEAQYSTEFLYRYFTGMAALVYHTPVGPLSVSVNYYHGEKVPFSFLFHFGYTIFNKRSID
ncbi:MAG: patatin-like phospholipase family protein [Bacteroidota bacterium]|nr:patatin-like phospholipase family protein [Bacteroidota bacterium]